MAEVENFEERAKRLEKDLEEMHQVLRERVKEHEEEIRRIYKENEEAWDKNNEEHFKQIEKIYHDREIEDIWEAISKIDNRVNVLLQFLYEEHPEKVPLGI